jgi:hypothetical protein
MHARTEAEVVGIILTDGCCGELKVPVVDISAESLSIVIPGHIGISRSQPPVGRPPSRIVGIETEGAVE